MGDSRFPDRELNILRSNTYAMKMMGEVAEKYNLTQTDDIILATLLYIKSDFKKFVEFFYPFVSLRNAPLLEHEGVKIICELLQLHFERKIDKSKTIIINIMPRAGKTTICDILYSAFLLANEPGEQIVSFTRSSKTAKEHHNYFNIIVRTKLYQSYFLPEEIRSFVVNKMETKLNNKSGRNSFTVMTSVTGIDATCIILDDPNEAGRRSLTEDEKIAEIITGSIEQRSKGIACLGSLTDIPDEKDGFKGKLSTEDNTRPMILIQQRLSKTDATGYLLETRPPEGLIHIKLSEFAEEDTTFTVPLKDGTVKSFVRHKGHLIDIPDILTFIDLQKQNQFVYQSQYQQNPINRSGVVLDPQFFRIYTTPISQMYIQEFFITTDYAFHDSKDSDSTCICVWGCRRTIRKCDIYLVDIYWGKINFNRKTDKTRELFDKYNNYKTLSAFCKINGVLIESNHNEDFISNLQMKFPDMPIRTFARNTSKIQRAMNVCETILGITADIYFPDETLMNRNTLQAIYRQCEAFTGSTDDHDDICDNIIDALTYIPKYARS